MKLPPRERERRIKAAMKRAKKTGGTVIVGPPGHPKAERFYAQLPPSWQWRITQWYRGLPLVLRVIVAVIAIVIALWLLETALFMFLLALPLVIGFAGLAFLPQNSKDDDDDYWYNNPEMGGQPKSPHHMF